jgi:hypothetical protein
MLNSKIKGTKEEIFTENSKNIKEEYESLINFLNQIKVKPIDDKTIQKYNG